MKFEPVKHSLLVRAEQIHSSPIDNLPRIGGRPCLDFINTVVWRLDPSRCRDTITSYPDLLRFSMLAGILNKEAFLQLSLQAKTEPQCADLSLKNALEFRAALTQITTSLVENAHADASPAVREAIEVFNAAISKARSAEQYVWNKGALHLRCNRKKEGLDLPWLALVRDAETMVRSSLPSRLRVCAGQGCGWVFLDTSKNGRRRWCSMSLCGNREKARRFLSQRRSI